MDPKKKESILIVTAEFAPMIGGLASYTLGLAQGFVSWRKKVYVLAPRARGKDETDYKKMGIILFRYPNYILLREILLVPYIFFLVLKFGIGHILCISWYPCGIVAMVNKWFLRVPYSVKVFGSDIVKKNASGSKLRHRLKRKFFWLMSMVFGNAYKIFPNSNYSKILLERVGAPKDKICVVNPGVDPKVFSPNVDVAFVVEKYGLEQKEVILSVARLEDYKGQDMIIRALETVKKSVPNILYLVVGSGPDEKKLKQLALTKGLKDQVIFIKRVSEEELVKLYVASRVFVMVSREMEKRVEVEGFGIVFLEASACGTPVIGGASGGIADAIAEAETGSIIDPLSSSIIADTIIRFIKNETAARAMGRAGRERIEKYFAWDKVAMKILSEITNA